MRSHRIAALSLGVVLSLAASSLGALAVRADSDDQQRKVAQIADQIEQLNQRADQLNEEYSQALADKAALDQEVTAAQGKVSAQEAQLGQLNVQLGQVAVHAYATGGSDGLGPLFSSPSAYSQILQRGELSKVALDAGAATGDELAALVDQLDANRKDLERKRQRADELTKVIAQKRTDAEQYGKQLNQTYVDAKAKYQDLVEQEQARRAAESLKKMLAEQAAAKVKADADAAAALAAKNAASSAPSATSGSRGGGATGADTSKDAQVKGPPAPPPSSKADIAIQAARAQLGVPYRYASSEPGVAFDCSGLTAYAWERAGVYLPHQSAQQYAVLPHVNKADAQPGDLIFSHRPISHVSLYIGGGLMIHAPFTGDVVKIAAVNWTNVVGVGRPG
jgi:cell wall-associated NlpC family hydrolase